jgi:hypothetical protein
MRAHNAPHYKLIPLEEVAYGLQVSPASTPDKHPRPYLRVANVQRDHLNLDAIKYIDVPDADLPKYLLQPGGLLFVEGKAVKQSWAGLPCGGAKSLIVYIKTTLFAPGSTKPRWTRNLPWSGSIPKPDASTS